MKKKRHTTEEIIRILPPVAYVCDESRPNGWIRASIAPDSIMLELRALDPNHPEHGKISRLAWREG